MIVLGLGSNRAGVWGTPAETIGRCLTELSASRFFAVQSASSLYLTAGVGPGRASCYVNAVVAGDSHLAPRALWSALRRLERTAGPRSAMPWGARSLDIDLLDYRNRVIGWPVPRPANVPGSLTVPHRSMHLRPFVLVPLIEAVPGWRHPVFGLSACALLHRLPAGQQGQVLRRIETGGRAVEPGACHAP